MIKWVFSLALYLIFWCANWFIAPIYSLFTAKGWPIWGKFLQTPDNLPVGDRQFLREGAPYPGIFHTGWKAWVNRTAWLYRNPMMGLSVDTLGYKPLPHDSILSCGNPRVGDKRKVEGLFSQYVYRQGKLVAFQHYYIKRWSETKCSRLRVGYKLSSWPNPKNNGKYQFVFAPTPWKNFG
jgi:hypothetical protein